MQDNTELLTPGQLGAYLGVSDQHIRDLQRDGVINGIPTGTRGRIKYNPYTAIPEYIAYVKECASEGGAKGRKLAAEAALKEAQAESANIQLEALRGRMHQSKDVKFFVSDLCAHMRSEILSFPARLTMKISGSESRAELSDIIERECHETLKGMAAYEYDPAKYRELAAGRKGYIIAAEEDEEEDEE